MQNTDSLELPFDLPLADLQERLKQAACTEGDSRRELAHFLANMEARKLYRESGHGTTAHYAEAWLDKEPRRTRELVQVGQALNRLELVNEAYAELGWSRTTAILSVIQQDTQAEWVDFACTHTFREIRREVKRSRTGDLPGDARFGLPHVKHRWGTELSDKEHERLERARRALAGNGPLDDHELLLRFIDHVLESQPDEEPAPPACSDEVDPNTTEIPADVRRFVLARDDHTCRNCGRRWGVHVHHIVFRKHGGSNETCNLLTICDTCHALVHNGKLHITGDADSGTLVRHSAKGHLIEPTNGVRSPRRSPIPRVPPAPPFLPAPSPRRRSLE